MNAELKANGSEMDEINGILGFQTIVANALRLILGADCHIEISDVKKNNGVIYHGINIIHGESRVGVNIYLDEYLKQYKEGREYPEIMKEICTQAAQCKREENGIMVSAECMKHYESVKEKLCCRLINTKANSEILRGIPSIPFLDLSIIFYAMVAEGKESIGSVTVHNEMLDKWNIEKEILLEDAMRNMDLEIENISDVVKSVLKRSENLEALEEFEKMQQICETEELPEMLVVSNKAKHYGAYSLICTEKLYEISLALDKNFFILPSSIHETILIPDTGAPEDKVMELLHMVQEINATLLLKEEILSNSVYYFNRDTREVTLLASGKEL